MDTDSRCPICDKTGIFNSPDDFYSCRDGYRVDWCPLGRCITRERAIARVLFGMHPRQAIQGLAVHEAAPTGRGLTSWLKENCPDYVQTGYFPDLPLGEMRGNLRNEDLERQTFSDRRFDIVLHLDVMEHMFEPFRALNEIHRTLRPGGHCLFTAPTVPAQLKSTQVAFRGDNCSVRIVGEPEYHGNPQHPEEGSLVTWRYGYDLPRLIVSETPFDVEVRRWQAPGIAVMGYMTEVYILTRIR